jgi:hypothetical protein
MLWYAVRIKCCQTYHFTCNGQSFSTIWCHRIIKIVGWHTLKECNCECRNKCWQ